MRSSSGYGFEYAKRSTDKAIKDLGEAETEYKASIPELVIAVDKLEESRIKIASLFVDDALIPVAQLKAVAAKNAPQSEVPASGAK